MVTIPRTTIAPAASSPATAGGTTPVTSRANHAHQDQDRLPGAEPKRYGLAANRIGLVHDEHAGVLGLRVKRGPWALEEEHVARVQLDLRLADVITPSLDGGDHQVSALGDHATEDSLAQERRSRRDDDLGEANLPVEGDRLGDAAGPEPVLANQRPRMLAQVGRDLSGRPCRQQPAPEQRDHDNRSGEQWETDQPELEEAERSTAVVRHRAGHQEVDVGSGEREL